MKAYSFDESTHTHYIGKTVVPGITTCLKPLYNFDFVPPAILQAACDWGSNVHKTIELYCNDDLDTESLDPLLFPILSGFIDWTKEHNLNRADFVVEKPMGDSSLMYGGIPDLILDGQLIVELKTRKCNMLTDSIQTAAQEALWKKNGGDKNKKIYDRFVLELKQDGKYVYTKVNENGAYNRYRHLLDHYYSEREIKQWK